MKRLKNLRQGQTRWKVVVYEPGKLQGYDDQYVAAVYLCFVTAVRGTTVNYQSGNGPYICGREWFIKNTAQTYRKALAQARSAVKAIEAAHNIKENT